MININKHSPHNKQELWNLPVFLRMLTVSETKMCESHYNKSLQDTFLEKLHISVIIY